MTTLRSWFLILTTIVITTVAHAQLYNQTPTNPLSTPGTQPAIDETNGGATVHMLTWTVTGNPTSCTIAVESAATAAAAAWSTILSSSPDCKHSGTASITGTTANFVRINLSAFSPATASITYFYSGTSTVGAAVFANAALWAKLDALRAVEALRHGITEVDHCPLFTPGPTADGVSYPTGDEFQIYHEPFGSSFNIAASFGDSGANGIPSAQNGIQTEALGQIQFETEHFFYNWKDCISHRPTFSFGGTVGLAPALVLENLTSTTETIANPNARPMFQDAFAWTLTPKLNVVTSHTSQMDLFATLGENYLIDQVTSFKQGDNTVTATPVLNEVGQSALFWELGLQWKLLNTDIVNAYINKTDVLNPPFDISIGYRNDSRFKRAGDLATFTNPQAYAFLRFTVGLDKIANWSSNTVDPGKGYTFKFGMDYERRLGGSNLPTSTRYYVSANFDIMHVFKPSTQAPAPQPAGGSPQQPATRTPPPAPHAAFSR
jgi:hypothetical protein